ncbi:MAG: hypothetical protein ACKV2U_26965 [Bryobacteraceae bacterium]
MKHYSIEKWADFVRGLTGQPESTTMESHLAAGCPSCNRMAHLLRALSEPQNEIEVPESVLARARAIFSRQPSQSESAIRALLAVLTFDSHRTLAPVGMRGADSTVRRLAYEAQDVVVELLIDTEPARRTVILTGQISSREQPGPPAPHRVRLLGKGKVLKQTAATVFGEFHLEFAPRAGLRLLIDRPPEGREIEVPLDLVPVAGNESSGAGSTSQSMV